MANDYIGVVTPAGTIYHLTQPDTKFNMVVQGDLAVDEAEAASHCKH